MIAKPTKKRQLVEEDDSEQVRDQAIAPPATKPVPRPKKSQPKRAGCLSGSSTTGLSGSAMAGLAGDALVNLAGDIETGLSKHDLLRLAAYAMADLSGNPTTGLGPRVHLPATVVLVFRSKKPIQKGEKLTTDNVEPVMILKAASNPDMLRRVNQGDAAKDKITARTILWKYMIK